MLVLVSILELDGFVQSSPFDFEYENIGAGCARLAETAAPVPMGPALALMFPPIVTFPPIENARTASSELSTITNSVTSAPIWRPHPTPPVAIQDGADQEPSGSLAITIPEPAFPEKTKPVGNALSTVFVFLEITTTVARRLTCFDH